MTDSELSHVAEVVMGAKSYVDVFGKHGNHLTSQFRKLAMVLHPDRAGDETETASAAFSKLTTLYESAKKHLDAGTYGKADVFTIETKAGRVYSIVDKIGSGAVADVYRGFNEAGLDVVLKMARSPRDRDLMENEAAVLPVLGATHAPQLFTSLTDSFSFMDTYSIKRQVNVLVPMRKFYTGTQVATYLDLDVLDILWIYRRLLFILEVVHKKTGFVHGAVVPDNIYIWPAEHAVVLGDWCFAVMQGKKVSALDGPRNLYPPEILEKRPVSPGTDIYMATTAMQSMLGENWRDKVPPQMQSLFSGCTLTSDLMRPQSAVYVVDQLDMLLHRLGRPFWPRQFREMTIKTLPTIP